MVELLYVFAVVGVVALAARHAVRGNRRAIDRMPDAGHRDT